MKIGISGASGQLGKALLEELNARSSGHDIVAISRTPAATGSAEARLGDYDRPETLSTAYAGLDRLALIPSPDIGGKRGPQLVSAIDAAVAAGVGHILFISAAGTREAAEPSLEAPYWTAEQHLIRTAPRWTILRMNYYAESFAEQIAMSLGGGVLTGLGDNRVAFVSRDDVAAAAAGILVGDDHAGAIYNATGPVAITGPERAALVAEAAGKPLRFAVIDEPQLRAGLATAGLPPAYVEAIVEIEHSFLAGKFDIVTSDIAHLAGRPPRPLGDVLRQRLA